MSNIFDDAGPASLFAPVKSKSEAKNNSPSETSNELPSLFSLTKKTSKKAASSKDKKDTKNKTKEDTPNDTPKEDKKPKKKKDSKKSKKNKEDKEKKETQDEKEDSAPLDQQEQENTEVNKPSTQNQIPKPKPKAKKVVKKVVVRRNNAQDIAKRTLNHIQNEITEQFAELFTTVESLMNAQKQPPSLQASIPAPSIQPSYKAKFEAKKQRQLNNDEILIKLQEAISDSLDKDKVLQDEQISIKKMVSTLTLTEEEEKSQLRKKIADLMETIAAEAANTADSQSEHEFRANEISRLHIELENVPKHYSSIEGKLRAERDEEVNAARAEYEKIRYSCDERIKQAKDKVRFINQQIILEGSKMANMATEKDLRRAVEESKNQLKDIIKNVALSVKYFVDDKVSKDKKYGGTTVRKIAMIALKRAMNRILNPGAEEENEEIPDEQDEQEENEKEEEEEEAEDQGNAEEDNENENEEENNENENEEENNENENEEENNENENEEDNNDNENEEENNENEEEEEDENDGEADENENDDEGVDEDQNNVDD